MSNAPHFSINLTSFVKDPYPYLKQMQLIAPISYVPELDATLLTLRNDIFVNEKKNSYLFFTAARRINVTIDGRKYDA